VESALDLRRSLGCLLLDKRTTNVLGVHGDCVTDLDFASLSSAPLRSSVKDRSWPKFLFLVSDLSCEVIVSHVFGVHGARRNRS